MPQDPHLYGQRPTKKQKKDIALSSSLNFTSQLTSLISTPSSSSPGATAGRSRPSKNPKDDIFSTKAKRKPEGAKKRRRNGQNGDDEDETRDIEDRSDNENGKHSNPLRLKSPRGTEDENRELAQARRKMEAKARLYNAMKRGDYIPKEGEAAPLVDFDRKWAERHPEDSLHGQGHITSSGEDNGSSDDEEGGGAKQEEMMEYTDDLGRTRRCTRTEYLRQQRANARRALGASELEALSARPIRAPTNLIHGDAIQHQAFEPEADVFQKQADLAAKRDKSPTPPPDSHFDGKAEIRTKGVGFYGFSKEKEDREREMAELAGRREETVKAREGREKEREERRRMLEERRKEVGKKRAERLAERFLDGLGGGGGGGAPGEEETKDEPESGQGRKASLPDEKSKDGGSEESI